MPRQAFYEPRAPRSHNNELESLAALSQIMNGIRGPQLHEQDSQRQSALAILGLMLQQQHQEDQLGLTQSEHADTAAHQRAVEEYQKQMLSGTQSFQNEQLGLSR